jgi:hypothetical protein
MTDISTYFTGTVEIAANGTTVTGTNSIWSGQNAMSGDTFSVPGVGQVKINSVTDATHLAIDAWPFSAVASGTAYSIKKDSPLRFVGAVSAIAVDNLVSALEVNGFEVFVPETLTAPDPSLGEDGQYAYQPTTGKRWLKQGGVWGFLGISDPAFSRYDIAVDVPGRPATNGVVAKWVAPSLVTFKATLPESEANADTAATAETVFSLKKNNAEFATATFSAAATIATFTCAADTAFNPGDVLTLVAPTRDESLANIAFTIVGLR